MDLAAKFVYVPKEEELEEIYEDEIIDGIAHCAMEQAQVLSLSLISFGFIFIRLFRCGQRKPRVVNPVLIKAS